ncbi:unnamed protein product [Paramecium sonneborni]|uniref:Uncharacterized protein n=1 Tax=Paramecium sonneborni TaxID=65129 RepID=A0A8S1RQ40_9CILI|nr:unnamed protein product [Paramecium sonneborni]
MIMKNHFKQNFQKRSFICLINKLIFLNIQYFLISTLCPKYHFVSYYRFSQFQKVYQQTMKIKEQNQLYTLNMGLTQYNRFITFYIQINNIL